MLDLSDIKSPAERQRLLEQQAGRERVAKRLAAMPKRPAPKVDETLSTINVVVPVPDTPKAIPDKPAVDPSVPTADAVPAVITIHDYVPAEKGLTFSEDELRQLAAVHGMKGLRKVGDPLGVKGTSKEEMIKEILTAQLIRSAS